jgi:aconitase A
MLAAAQRALQVHVASRCSMRSLRCMSSNPFASCIRTLETVDGKTKQYYSLQTLGLEKVQTLPFAIRVLLESAMRNCDGAAITEADVHAILNWSAVGEPPETTQVRALRVATRWRNIIGSC